MSDEKCGACRFWMRWGDECQPRQSDAPRKGSCHRGLRHVQTMLADEGPPNEQEDGFMWVWPTHRDDDWCGEWQAKRVPLPVAESNL